MKKVAAFIVSILIGMSLVIYSYAAENTPSILEEKHIDVNGIYISDYNNVSIGKINGDEIRIGDVNISVVSEAIDNGIRFAVNEVKPTDDAFDYVRTLIGTGDIKVFFFNFIEESNNVDDVDLKLKINGFDGQTQPTVYFIDNEGNNQLLSVEFINGALFTSSLDKPLNNSNVDSLITYYLLSQKLDYAMQRFDYYYTTENGKPELQIKRIIAEIDNYGMANICDKNHSLLAYDYGYGSWRWNGVTYGGCIYLCDPNCSDHFDETYCLYFNTNSYNWVIPHYGTKKSSVNGDYIDFVVGDPDILNTCGYLSGNSKSSIEQYYGNLTANLVAENHSVSKMVKGDKGYSKTAANENDIISCMRPNMINGTDDDVLNYILRDVNSAYTLNQNNPEPLDLSIDYEDCFLEASSKAGKSVIFDNNGYVEIKGESADYSMSMTFNNDYPTDWFTIKVSGIGANTASIEKDNNGWIISSDNLKNVEVRTNNKEVSAFTRFSTNYPSALIYEIDKNTIGIKVDTDNNGTYETILNTAVLPKITATSGDSSVTLKWTAVPGAERYGIAGYVNGKWQNLAECSSTYYTLNDLKAGTIYKVAVIAKVNGTWNKDYFNAITVTPNKPYPIVKSEVQGRQFRLKWTAVSGAEKYGIAVYQSGGWRVKVQLNGNTTTYTSPKMKSGTYKMVVCAKINGSWDTSNIKSRAFIVTLV